MKVITILIACTIILAVQVKSQKPFKFLSIGNDTIELCLDKPTIIIFVNQNRCGRCFEDLSILFKNNKKGLKSNKIILARVGQNTKTRRSFIAPLKSYFDVCDSCCFFDVNDWSVGIEDSSSVAGLFNEYHVYNTPAVLFIKKNETRIWLYSDIFYDDITLNRQFISYLDYFEKN